MEIPRVPERLPQELANFAEKLDFLRDKFLLGGEIKPTREVALPGEEVAEVEFGGDLFVGQITQEIKDQIKASLGVDLDSQPSFKLEGQFRFDVWAVPESSLFLLVREVDGETEILAYEEEMVEIFSEAEGLERI